MPSCHCSQSVIGSELARTSFHLRSCPILGCALVLLWLCGCATHTQRIQTSRQAFYANDIEASLVQFEKIGNRRRDKDCVELDLAMIDLTRGEAASCERRLRKVRDNFDFLEQKSIAESTTAYLTDERAKAYAGEEYERILIRAFLSISNLFNGGVDAEAYSLQLDDKQCNIYEAAYERLGEEKIQQYPIVPFGFYVRGMLREATLHDYDDAVTNYAKVCEFCPNIPAFTFDLQRASQGNHCSPGMGVLYVFALTGQGPQKIASKEQPTSDALLIADRIISAAGPFTLPPTIAPIQVPAIEVTPSAIDRVLVSVDQKPIGPTDTVANINYMAMQAYELNRNENLARAVARRVVKKASVVVAKDAMNTDPLVSLAMDAAGVAWEATEVADTRCWSLLPGEIQVIRIEAPIGHHRIGLRAMNSGRPFGSEHVSEVDIRDGQNTYMLANMPNDRVIGSVSVSQ